jgi:hypothetical protein
MQMKWKAAVLLCGIAVAACSGAPRPAPAPPPMPADGDAHGQMQGMHGMQGMGTDTSRRPSADTAHHARADTSAGMAAMPGMPGMQHAHADTVSAAMHGTGDVHVSTGEQHAGGTGGAAMRGMSGHASPDPMAMVALGGGWTLMGMAQAFPTFTAGAPGESGSPLHRSGFYVTQPAVMANVESPGSRLVLRTTVNFEPLTQPGGELTFGGWGEGFIDKRHPHTLLHELMLSANVWNAGRGSVSVSAGKGFAPFGTDDPMSRPVVKYPTNHHLSQILERWTLNGAYRTSGWTLEAGLFGGQEPQGPYDLGNWRSFGDSWSARVTRGFGAPAMGSAPWELSASYGSVREERHGVHERDRLWNGAVRHQGTHALGGVYALAEASIRKPADGGDGWWAVLGETEVTHGRHQPYYRVEYATRPEYARDATTGSGFFRYDHDADPVGATRWLVDTFGYRYGVRSGTFAAAPFVEAQHNRVSRERGPVTPDALFGTRSFWSLSAGVRIFLGGGPMRMGSYGVRDDMTGMHREMGMGMGMNDGMRMQPGTPRQDAGQGTHH